MDLSTKYNVELAVLAERSDGTVEDAIREWAYEPERYPTLIAYARKGIVTHTATATDAAALKARAVFDERVRRLAAAVFAG